MLNLMQVSLTMMVHAQYLQYMSVTSLYLNLHGYGTIKAPVIKHAYDYAAMTVAPLHNSDDDEQVVHPTAVIGKRTNHSYMYGHVRANPLDAHLV